MNENTFYKSFSGSDAIAYMIFNNTKPILLGNITTISYSVMREKRPIPTIGRINPAGYTRGMRTVAGSMIFTTINQHLVKDIIAQVPFLRKYNKIKVDELPLFDIMVICANEYGASAQMMIYGIDILEEGQVISIDNLFMENSFSFVARDVDEFSRFDPYRNGNQEYTIGDNVNSVSTYDMDFLTNPIDNQNLRDVQLKLNEMALLDKVSGIYDNDTVHAVKEFQRMKGLTVNGKLNDLIIDSILDVKLTPFKITNRRGACVYSDSKLEELIGISKYGENFSGVIEDNLIKTKYNGFDSYIKITDTNL